MPRIPTIVSEPTRDVLPNSGNPAYATPAAFGSEIADATARGGEMIGASVRQLAGSLISTGVAIGDYGQAAVEKARKSQVANSVANFDYTKTFLDLQKQRPAGMTYAEAVASTYDEQVNKHVDAIDDNDVRGRVREALMTQKRHYIGSAVQFSNHEASALDKADADTGFNLQANRVRSDGSIDTYNDAITKTNGVIDARPNLTEAEKTIMKKKNAELLAMRRFEGLISTASGDPDQLAAIEGELTAPNSIWKGRMSDEAFDRMLDRIGTLKKAANSQESSAARSALQSVNERNDKGELIDPTELSAVQDTVAKAKNPALLSQFALINRAQEIYREHRGLPLEQQREKIEALKKKDGVAALPAPVKQGVTEGSQLTGGVISPEFLAGLAGVEYGQFLATGDYGKRTTALVNGKPASDAMGVGQFTSPTWRGVLRQHADALGVDRNASDAELDAMRADPVLSMKAAALHALDNKKILEAAFNRPVNEADLYFAHLLGTNGAVRFLQGAQQSPASPATKFVDEAQVNANKGVFYDEAGRPRQAWQVRSFVSGLLMNNLSRADYAGVKAAALVYNNTVKGLKDDPITFASSLGRFGDVGDISKPEGLQRRGVVAQQVAEYYNIPSSELKPFTHNEAEALAKKARDGTAEETLQVMSQIQALGSPETIKAGNRQIGEKDALFGYAASLAYNVPASAGVASDIIRGEKRMKEDKDVTAAVGQTDAEMQATFTQIVGKALAGTRLGTETRKAATAHYIEKQMSRGSANPGRFDKNLFEDSVNAVLGAAPGQSAIGSVNGGQTLLPNGVDASTFETALSNMTNADFVGAAKWASPPRYADGKVAQAGDIAREGKFEAIGGGEYRVKMGDGKYLFSSLYKDGSGDVYIFRATPQQLQSFAARRTAPTASGTVLP